MDVKELIAEMNAAREAGNVEAYNAAMSAYVKEIAGSTAEEKLEATVALLDKNIMIARGKPQLTSEETKFYSALIKAVKSDSFKSAITETDVVIPQTTIETVFDDLTVNHPIFAHVDQKVVNAKVKVIFAKSGSENKAVWGAVDAKITKEVSGSFEEMEVYQKKITAFIPLPLYLMDLGYPYIDRFVRTILGEAMLNGFEDAIINGLTSVSPIGMIADLSKAGSTDSSTGITTFTAQTPVKVTELTAEGLKAVMKKMARTRNGNPRQISGLFLVHNPDDYYTLIKPAISVQNALGDFVDRMPYNIAFVPSIYMPEGKAILGIDKQYALGVGTFGMGKIEYSDDFQFLDDKRTYKIKAYGNGMPKDPNSFVYLDISGLKRPKLEVTGLVSAPTTGA